MAKEIVTSTGQKSKSFDFAAFKLADQINTGLSLDSFESEWMARGSEMEEKARELYQITTGIKIAETGMIFRDKKKEFGCSPDGIAIKGGLEIKCPSYEKHQRYRYEKKLPTDHKPQVYSSLWVCDELEYWDFFSYYPGLNPFLIRITREDEGYKKYIEAFEKYLPEFLTLIKTKLEEKTIE